MSCHRWSSGPSNGICFASSWAPDYFYKTQPVPNPWTRYFHWMPPVWHKCEVVTNHFVEIVAPWLLLIPGLPMTWRRTGGPVQLLFQAVLIASGNLSFLNWLTMVPAILCLDDALISRLFYFGPATQKAAMLAAAAQQPTPRLRRLVSFAFLLLILQLSVPVVRNFCAEKQVMNSSFDPLHLVNSYGAFGVVN
jgi:lipase maturation factor 1